jgi:hypothetical protein
MNRILPFALLALMAPAALAQAPATMAHQGYLLNGGAPANGTYTLAFRLFTAASGGTQVWTETQSGLAVTDGVYGVTLGTVTPLTDVYFAQPLWLEVQVGATVLTPRTRLAGVPYARTLSAPAQVVGAPAAPVSVLYVEHQTASGEGSAVYGSTASPDGQGVTGRATAPSGLSIGVYGLSQSTAGFGVYGSAEATTGTTYGVWGINHSTSGTGVYGRAAATTGTTKGVWGTAATQNGRGVLGEAHWAGVGFGTPVGVYGYATAADPSASPIGIYGEAPSTGYAGYFEGEVIVFGVLSKAGGSFEIDHPLDPEHRILRHSFVESPDMMNVYNGNTTTDARGYATVVLPEWFEALNRDFRYQLTTIGSFSRAMVAEEIEGNRFVIRTEEPGVRVSWQVTGIRHDAWANENRIVVEEDKRPEHRGLYLHPAAFGLPRERGVNSPPEQEASPAREAALPVAPEVRGR